MVKKGKNKIFESAEKHLILSMIEKLEPIIVSEAKGALIKSVEGHEYVDCFSGISVVNAGHGHKKIIKAAVEQAKKYVHVCNYLYHNPVTIKLAEKLALISPNPALTKTFFGSSGAEAIECAIKLSKKFTKKQELLALTCSFHGRTVATLSITGQSMRKRYDMGPYLSGVAFAPAPYCYRCPLQKKYPKCDISCAHYIEHILDYTTSNNVAAFIAEPILGEGGIITPPIEYFGIVKEILDKQGILFITDEVQTGFGRTGMMFGIEHYGVKPDIITMAKGIANGFPLGACLTRLDIGNSFEIGDHLSTFGGNPVSAAAALATIDVIINEKLSRQSAEKGKYCIKRIREMKKTHPIIGDVRGKGLMIGIELVKDKVKKVPAIAEAKKVREKCRQKRVLIGVGGVSGAVLRIQPPLIIEKRQLDKALEIIEEKISLVEKTGDIKIQ